MASTAHIENDRMAKAANEPYQTGLLPAWLYNNDRKISPGCTLVDISCGGAALLVPRNQAAPCETFELVVMSQDDSDAVLTILQAEQRWKDEAYSDAHIKIGIEFINISPVKLRVITALSRMIGQKPARPYPLP